MSCDVGTRDFRLDSSRLFYVYKFNLVVHKKDGNEQFTWTTKPNLRRSNKRDKSSLKSHFPESTLQL